jgi:diguanylate cyclase (GGDEF)-like protein
VPIQLSDPQSLRVREALSQVKNYVDNTLKPQLTGAVGQYAGLPQQFTSFSSELSNLQGALQPGSGVGAVASISEGLAPVVATVVAYYRRRFVSELEDQRARAVADELLRNIDSAKASIDDLLNADWYRSTKPLRLPRLRDFVAPSRYDVEREPPARPRNLEDKFGILWSASHLLPDLAQMRQACEERSAPVAISFVDVDGLKALNSELGETWVDALVLPPIMRSVEAAIFGHGYAYRYGGDEFVLLSPSADREVALAILRRLRGDLTRTRFENIAKSPTVSVGLCVVHPDSPLTDREALHWAAMAKKHAKTAHNAIAVAEALRGIGDPVAVIEP